MTANRQQLIIFARAPITGQCKTRLHPLLGQATSTQFYKDLLTHCIRNASQLNSTDITLYTTPDIDHPFLRQLAFQYEFTLQPQLGNDIGERMHHAIEHSLRSYERTVLIGSDCLELNAKHLQHAFNALNHHDMVIGPATDGGYVLIGGNRISADVFRDTVWSTEHVLQQCIKNMETLNYQYTLLDALNDIDTPDDFMRNLAHIKQQLGQQYI